MMSCHNLLNSLLVEIEGEGSRSVDQIRQLYDYYRVPEPEDPPDIRCGIRETAPQLDEVLGIPEKHYGRDGDQFVVQNGPNFLCVDRDWQQYEMSPSPGWEPYKTVYLVEFELRRRLLAEQRALIHASAVQFEGQTILFPAWRSAGKTNTLFSLLFAGGDYLSDDRVWVDETGEVLGYPCTVNRGNEQVESFSELEEGDKDVTDRVRDFVDDQVDPSRSLFDKGVSFLNQSLLEEDRVFRSIDEMVPGTDFIERQQVDAVVLLRAAPERSHVAVEEVPGDPLAKALRAIHHYEWNGQLEEYFMAFDSLFPDEDRSGTFDRVVAEEEHIFRTLLDSVPTYVARIPRETDWESTGIRSEVVEEFSDLAQAPEHSPIQ